MHASPRSVIVGVAACSPATMSPGASRSWIGLHGCKGAHPPPGPPSSGKADTGLCFDLHPPPQRDDASATVLWGSELLDAGWENASDERANHDELTYAAAYLRLLVADGADAHAGQAGAAELVRLHQRAEELAKQQALASYFDDLDNDELELEMGSQEEDC